MMKIFLFCLKDLGILRNYIYVFVVSLRECFAVGSKSGLIFSSYEFGCRGRKIKIIDSGL